MISVLLKRTKNGMLLCCEADGHACYAKAGTDIVCSAVTVLLRTTLQVLSRNPDLEVKADAPKRGNIAFDVKMKKERSELELELKYAGDFLEIGLKSLQKEFPAFVGLKTEIV